MTPFELVEICNGIRFRRMRFVDDLAELAVRVTAPLVGKKKKLTVRKLTGRPPAERFLPYSTTGSKDHQAEVGRTIKKMAEAQARRDAARAKAKAAKKG